ncbi:dTMP kinase [Xanthomonas sontii]|uniref:dTMP kinase n=1 Tax=Xanthomonas sontii TaxID=2650745 RepID=UPI0011E43108|nr:dTMP kinase [Xanthomonas sontii]MDQ7761309.1 dTMP kinase [Xanthomonas sontii]UZK08126.1 dTMP kinase [Xanthomonas sontii]
MTKDTIPGGLLIAIEGIDGAGKSTLARSLAAALEANGAVVNLSKEPTTGPWGMKLRDSAAVGRLSPAQEVEYLLLDRQQHVHELIAPALERGEIVILDRYFPSMIAYQGAAGLPVDELLQANSFAPRPNLLLLLDLDPLVGLQRIRARGDAPNHFETPDNLEKCRAIFLALADSRMRRIDASKDAEAVLLDARAYVAWAIGERLAAAGMTVENVEKMGRLNADAFL